jgi:peptidoglycan/LPS O-acetylase OafA/YrhL
MAVILLAFGNPFSGTGETLKQLLAHLLFVHNLWPETSGTINGVFWSLGVEVQFYVLFPLLYLAYQKKPHLISAALVIGALAYRIAIARGYPGWLDFRMAQLPAFLDFFALGMLAARLHETRPAPASAATAALAIGSFAAYGGLLYWAHTTRYAPGITTWQVLGRTWLALAFFAMTRYGLSAGRIWTGAVANPILVFLSAISYNLYLWHQFIGRRLLQWRWPDYVGTDPHEDPRWQLLFMGAAILVSVLISAVLTYGFERPLLARGTRPARVPNR